MCSVGDGWVKNPCWSNVTSTRGCPWPSVPNVDVLSEKQCAAVTRTRGLMSVPVQTKTPLSSSPTYVWVVSGVPPTIAPADSENAIVEAKKAQTSASNTKQRRIDPTLPLGRPTPSFSEY